MNRTGIKDRPGVTGGAAVTNDGRLIGWIINRRDGVNAVAANGRALGRFRTDHAAAVALLAAQPPRTSCNE
jgi:hypothetical protein